MYIGDLSGAWSVAHVCERDCVSASSLILYNTSPPVQFPSWICEYTPISAREVFRAVHVGQRYHASRSLLVVCAKPRHNVSFYGLFWMPGDIRIVHVRCDWDLCEPITAVVHYDRFDKIVGGALMRSFAGFV